MGPCVRRDDHNQTGCCTGNRSRAVSNHEARVVQSLRN